MTEPTAELNQLRELSRARAGSTYAKIINELMAHVFLVKSWTKVSTSGSAVPVYTQFGAEYDVRYQEGNLANIVHELTHMACYISYDNDFLCWHPTARVKPARTYSRAGGTGYVTNQEALQAPEKDALAPLLILGQQIKACIAGSDLSATKKKMVVDKMEYGTTMYAGVEFDPCVNNVLGWLVEWGYPKRPSLFTSRNANQLFNAVEQVAYEQYKKRTGKT
ncbi:hypothetical protein [Duganella sp. Dugasp56]|jgi:hypothetical protein|uniref:hypothetical protein n=1 Tax=unclassified Duganella TaxID=2636909 RepID=UPI00159E337B